jgi:hypothetical protein
VTVRRASSPTVIVLAGALLAALLALAPAADAGKRRVPHGFYGVMWGRTAEDTPAAGQEEQWAVMARTGVESARAVFSWAQAQPSAGTPPSFESTDRLVSLAARHRIRLLPVVIDTPDWARAYPSRTASPPARNIDYTAYLTALVRRYGHGGEFWSQHPELPNRPIREWQIWNEPHLSFQWDADDWPTGYADLLRASYPAIKQTDPGARVVMAALADFAWRHVTKLYEHGIRGYFDLAAINFFTARPRNLTRGVRRFRKALTAGGNRHLPIYMTETTFPASKGRNRRIRRPSWQKAWETSDRGMARRIDQTYRVLAGRRTRLGLDRVYWYTWSSGYRADDIFDYTGLMRYDGSSFTARPALRSYRASAQRYEGCAKTTDGYCRG